MSKDERVSMPVSTAGITRYFDEEKSKIRLKPMYIIILAILVIIIVAILHIYGGSWVGLS